MLESHQKAKRLLCFTFSRTSPQKPLRNFCLNGGICFRGTLNPKIKGPHGGESITFLGKLCLCLTTISAKNQFHASNLNLSCLSFQLLNLIMFFY